MLESPSFLSCTQLCRRQKVIKPDLEMHDLKDHDSRPNTYKKGGHDRQIYWSSPSMLPTWRQQQRNRQFIWNSKKHLILCHKADQFEKVASVVLRTDKTNSNRFKDTYQKETGQLLSAEKRTGAAGHTTTDKFRLFPRLVTLERLCSQLLHLLMAHNF